MLRALRRWGLRVLVPVALAPLVVDLLRFSDEVWMSGDAISNLAPATAPVVAYAIAQVAAVLLVRDALDRWAGRSRLVRWVGARSMGLYRWRLTAMFAVSGVALLTAGRVLAEPWTWEWWTTRAEHLGAAAPVLVVLVALASRIERRVTRSSRPRRLRPGSQGRR